MNIGMGVKLTQPSKKGTPGSRPMKRVCLYYGNMTGINGNSTPGNAGLVYAQYDVVVFAGGVQDPGYYDYARTPLVITATKAGNPAIEIFGYVPIGADPAGSGTSNLTMTQMKTQVSQWVTVGATGIFLDEFGYDYLVTRERQNEIVDYCHSLGLNVIANSWSIDHVWSSGNGYVDWRSFYGNPNLLAPSINSRDYYLFENMFFKWSSATQKTSDRARVYDAVRYYQEPQAEYGGATYYQRFGTRTIALDGIQHDHAEKTYMFNRGYLGALLLNMDGYAPSVEDWADVNYNHFTQSYGITRRSLVPVTITPYGGRTQVFYDGDVGGHHIQLVWNPDLTTPDSYAAGYHLIYLDGVLMKTGSASQPTELPAPVGPPVGTNIASAGLIYYYSAKAGYTGTKWLDQSGNGWDANIVNASTDTDGIVFNGSTSRGSLPSGTNVPAQTTFTAEIALKIPTALAGSGYMLMGYLPGNGGTDSKALSVNSSRVARIFDGNGSQVSTYTVPLNTVVFLTYKRINATTVALYVNGVFNSNITTTLDVTGITGGLVIGTDDSSPFKGTIALIRQYNRALSDAEILQNYNVGLSLW